MLVRDILLFLIGSHLVVMYVLVRRWIVLRKMRDRLHGIAVSAAGLHTYRGRKCVAAEQRQPYGQKYRNKFSRQAHHGHSLAKNSVIVNEPRCIAVPRPIHRNLV